jgi:hypothetical protein
MPPTPDESFMQTEEPDVVIGHFIGRVTVDDVQRIYEAQRRFSEGKPHIFLLVDVSRLVHFTPEARRVAAQGPGGKGELVPILGSAFIGTSFHVRVLVALFFRAARVLSQVSNFPVRFVDSQAEALAWFDERRRELGLPRTRCGGPTAC